MVEARDNPRRGGIAPGEIIMIGVAGVVIAIIGGAIYGYYLWYVQYLDFLAMMLRFPATIAFGVALGAALGWTLRRAKVTSTALVGWLSLAVALLAVYTSWVFWLLAWSGHDYFSPLGAETVFSAIAEVAEEGIYYTPKWYMEGTGLYILWSVEAVASVFLCWSLAGQTAQSGGGAFCNRCKAWAEEIYLSPDLAEIKDRAAFRAELERDPLARLLDMPRAGPELHGTFSRVRIQACPQCGIFHSLDVQGIKRWLSSGVERSAEITLIKDLTIDKRTHDALAREHPNTGPTAR